MLTTQKWWGVKRLGGDCWITEQDYYFGGLKSEVDVESITIVQAAKVLIGLVGTDISEACQYKGVIPLTRVDLVSATMAAET